MDFFVKERFRRIKFYQMLVGHWPYIDSKVISFQRAMILILTFHYFAIQVLKLRAMEYDINLLVEILSPIFAGVVCIVKYCTQWYNMKLIKELLQSAKYHWKLLNDQQEIQILYKFTRKGMLCEKIYSVILQILVISFATLHMLPFILDIFAPLNEPRPRRLPFMAEYFIDAETYFYPILFHMIFLVAVASLIILSSDLIFMSFMTHACGMYIVVGYQLERIFDDLVHRRSEALTKYKIRSKLKRFVHIHVEIMKYVAVINCCYTYSLLIQWLLGVIGFAVVEFQLFRKLMLETKVDDAIQYTLYALVFLFVIVAATFPGQMLWNYSSDLFYRAYFGYWYCACVEIQKSLLVIMHQCMKPAKVFIGYHLETSFETLALTLRLSISYFMMLYSMRDRILSV